MKMNLYRVCWVRPYYALLALLGLCVLTVVVSLLYLEDAALKMPHARLLSRSAPSMAATTKGRQDLALSVVRKESARKAKPSTDYTKQLWPDHKQRKRLEEEKGFIDGVDVKVLNSLEFVMRNLTHHHSHNNPIKESQRLGIRYENGTAVFPPHLLSGDSPAVGASSSSRSRYIIYKCAGNMTCCGWGDRQHGILSAYLISLVTNRTFGVDMSSPCPLTVLFHPRIIDWKVNASSLAGLTSRHIYSVNDWLFRMVMQRVDIDTVYPEDVIYLTTNYDYYYALRSNPHYSHSFRKKVHGKPRPLIFADLWLNIFKLNKRVRRRIDRALKLARPTAHHKLVCGHVRLGKNPSIPNDFEVRNTLQTIKPLWNFLNHFKDPKKYRIFVPSDSEIVRTKVLDMYPGQAVDVKGDIMHIDKTQVEDACLGFEKVLADQYLLSMCDVLVLTYSVFGKSAAYMRRSNRDLYFMENGTIKPLQLFKEKT